MLPSEKLRLLISKLYGINLEQYAWNEELKKVIFSIKLDMDLESNAKTLGEIYQYGFNIGHCGLTSRYVTRTLEGSTLHYGIAKLLNGTKSSPNGEHAWTVINDLLIDTTLMICFPIDKMRELGYETQAIIASASAQILSEYDLFDNEFIKLNGDPNFQDELYKIKRRT